MDRTTKDTVAIIAAIGAVIVVALVVFFILSAIKPILVSYGIWIGGLLLTLAVFGFRYMQGHRS